MKYDLATGKLVRTAAVPAPSAPPVPNRDRRQVTRIATTADIPPGSLLSEATMELIQQGRLALKDGPRFLTPLAQRRVMAAIAKRSKNAL